MEASSFPLNTSATPVLGSKGHNIFSESGHVAYQIKGMKRTETYRHTFVVKQTLDPWDGVKR